MTVETESAYAAGLRRGREQGREQGYRDAVRAMTRLNTDVHSRDMLRVLKAMIDLGIADRLVEQFDEDEAGSAYWHTEVEAP